MASFNSVLFLTLLVAISTFIAALSSVEAQVLPTYLLNINGTVPCTTNVTLFPNAPPFPNALVQLQCAGNVAVANTTTNSLGVFGFVLGPLNSLVSNLFTALFDSGGCNVVVPTPLAQCNVTLPASGFLGANLTRVLPFDIPIISNFVPGRFQFSPII